MRLCPDRRGQPVRIRLTAMIDVVFLLIIFFMTVSQLTRDVTEDLPLPEAEQGRPVQDRQGRIILNVDRDGQVIAAGERLREAELLGLLQRAVQVDGADEVKCVLRVDRHTPFQQVQELMGLLARSGVWRIAYSVVEAEG